MTPEDSDGGDATLTVARVGLKDQLQAIDPKWLFGVSIHGVEVTQAIQYYRAAEHLSDPSDRSPDNSVTLVVGKPAWVRVYVRSGILPQINGVTGSIEVSRRHWGFFYTPVGTINPQPPGAVVARSAPAYADERGVLTNSLNFCVPASWMCGHLRLRVRITAPGGRTDETTLYIEVTLQQTLRLAGIMIGYNGPASSAPGAPNLTLPAPSVANMQTTSGWTLLTFPVRSAATYRSAGSITWNLPLTDPPSCPGCCTPNWVSLNAAVQAQRVADGNRSDVLYYGLMAIGIPMGLVIGCNSGSVSSGSNGNGVTMAHELGHACGLPHAPCGTPGDPNYPAYEPYDPVNTPQASIGEYGLDISTGAVMSPSTFKDFMSYCGPRWVSLYNYGRLMNNDNLAPVRTCVDYPWWRDVVLYDPLLIPEKWLPDPPPGPEWRKVAVEPEPLISIIGVVHSDDRVEVRSIVRLEAQRRINGGRESGLVAELVDASNRVSASAPIMRLPSLSHGCGCEGDGESQQGEHDYLFQSFVSDVATGAQIQIRRGEEILWARAAPVSKPRLLTFTAKMARADQLRVSWRISSADDTLPDGWLQWSDDRGRSWQALATGLRPGSGVVDASALPSGRVSLRLLVSDGFHTARSKLVSVTMPVRAPAVSILSPREKQTLVAGAQMRLLGAVTSQHEEPPSDEHVRWLLDGGVVATGLDAFVVAPSAGDHRLTLTVREDKRETKEAISFTTVRVSTETADPS